MNALFLKLLNMSITASFLVAGIFLLRLLLRKTPKWIFVLLWGLVALRLLLPISIESKQSLIPTTTPVPQQILTSPQESVYKETLETYSSADPLITEYIKEELKPEITPAQRLLTGASHLWLLGMALMTAYSVFSYLRLRRSLREAVPYKDGIWICDGIPTPFLLGFFRPRIYIPSDVSEEDIPLILAHERAHQKRKDHWWKPLGYLLLTVYWFNPVLWLAYLLLCRDIESACDERVIKELGSDMKKSYSVALLRCSVPERRLTACPLAFGEGNVKKRIFSVLSYKKPTFWILLVALIGTVLLSLWFLTDPKKEDSQEALPTNCWFDLLLTDSTDISSAPKLPSPVDPATLVHLSGNRLYLEKNGEKSAHFLNNFIINGYLSDLNGDGISELCCTALLWMEGYLSKYPVALVYDFVTDTEYSGIIGPHYFTDRDGALTMVKYPYESDHDLCFAVDNFQAVLTDILHTIKTETPIVYTEPILMTDPRLGSDVLAYILDGQIYPFSLTWTGDLLSDLDDEGLTAFLMEAIPTVASISPEELESARSTIHMVETDPTAEITGYAWTERVEEATRTYYGLSVASHYPIGKQILTMEDVIRLSQKEMDLTWDDLAPYECTDIGSGLYVMQYPIDDRFYLQCSDGSLSGYPMAVFLGDRETELAIDIRSHNVESFLSSVSHLKWFGSENRTGVLTAFHPTIDDLRFSYDHGNETITVYKGETAIHTLQDTAIFAAYFADVTLDGTPDLCCDTSSGYGISYGGILIYDPIADQSQKIAEPLVSHYSLEEQGGSLWVRRTHYYDAEDTKLYDLRAIASNALPEIVEIFPLMEKYPQYFGLKLDQGLILYVSHAGPGVFACRLVAYAGTDDLPDTALSSLTPCSVEEMKGILRTYPLKQVPLYLVPVETSYSAKFYASPADYEEGLADLFSDFDLQSIP